MSRIIATTILMVICAPSIFAQSDQPAEAAESRVVFSRDIQPLLAKHCLLCHGPDEAEAGLRLDVADAASATLDSGARALVPGDADASELLRRVTTADESERMPPEGEPLTVEQIAVLRQWINEGANYERHWAYRPIQEPVLPTVQDQSWVRRPLDRFVLARIERAGITASPEADRPTLMKRLAYDLVGLPPTPQEVDAFVGDDRPDAYERLVDRLLASEHFGERWGRHWLDKARYADSDGYEKDRPRPNAWRYRDWVIESVNRDVPFDQFTIEQLAGDLLPNASPMQQLATAFHRQTLTNTEGGTDQEEFRVEATFDRAETTAAVWMALTLTCARCHAHKYDQISQRDYYQLFAFFNNANEVDTEVASSEAALAQYRERQSVYEAQLAALSGQYESARIKLQPRVDAWEAETAGQLAAAEPGFDPLSSLPEQVAAALQVNAQERSEEQRRDIADHVASFDPRTAALAGKLAELKAQAPPSPMMTVPVMAPIQRTTSVLYRGDFLQPGEEASADALPVIAQVYPLNARRPDQPPDRLDLAQWLVDPQHPLAARVLVNQVWAHLFGRGIVPTVNDFGVRGEPPTHPELLDWLAWHFPRDMGWSRKALIKTIVMSATYRQSSHGRGELDSLDPTNQLLARQNRLRVEGEIVRDLYLAASGLLSTKMGGPSVFPPLPPGVAELSYANNFKWATSPGEDRYRRGMYTFFKRTSPHPTLISFDCPDSNTTKLQRDSSNTPLQALVTLNNEVFSEAAEAMARRVIAEGGDDDLARLTYALRLCVARQPETQEVQRFHELLTAARDYYAQHPDDAKQVTRRHATPQLASSENAAWVVTVRMIMNLDEFLVRD